MIEGTRTSASSESVMSELVRSAKATLRLRPRIELFRSGIEFMSREILLGGACVF